MKFFRKREGPMKDNSELHYRHCRILCFCTHVEYLSLYCIQFHHPMPNLLKMHGSAILSHWVAPLNTIQHSSVFLNSLGPDFQGTKRFFQSIVVCVWTVVQRPKRPFWLVILALVLLGLSPSVFSSVTTCWCVRAQWTEEQTGFWM